MANTIRIRYTADTRDLKRGTAETEGQLRRLNDAGKRTLGGLDKAALALGVSFGAAGLAGFLGSSVTAAKEAERASAALGAQIDALGLNYAASKDHIDDVITAQSKLAALDDEELMSSFTAIVRVTKDVNKALELNALAADIARGRNMDLVSAGELVAKVAGGNTSILKRYGIVLQEGATATQALGELQRLFAGQAEAYGESNAGAADRAAVAWENAKEQLGERLLPLITRLSEILVDKVIPAVTAVAGVIDKVAQAVGGWERAIQFILGGLLARKVLDLSGLLTTRLVPAITGVGTASVAASTIATGPQGFGKVATFLGRTGPIFAAILVLQDLLKNGGDVTKGSESWKDMWPINIFTGPKVTLTEAKGIVEPHLAVVGEASAEAYTKAFRESTGEFLVDVWNDLKKNQARAAEDLGKALGVFAGQGFAGAITSIINQSVNAAFGSTGGFQPSPTLTGSTSPATSYVGGLPTSGYTGPGARQSGLVAGAVNYAVGQQGRDYVWGGGHGGTGPSGNEGEGPGFDCSGLIYQAYKSVGVTVPALAESWSSWPYKVKSTRDLMPGDVIQCNGGGHVVLYIGNGKVIAASGGPSGGGADEVVVQGIPSGITGMFRPVPGAVVPAATVGEVVSSVTPTSSGGVTIPGVPSRPAAPPEKTYPSTFPAITGISDRFQGQFEHANREGTYLVLNPDTGKYESRDVTPDAKALKKLADRIRTKELPKIRKKIRGVRKALRNKKLDPAHRASLQALLAALLQEEQELKDLWRDVMSAWNDLKPEAGTETGGHVAQPPDFADPPEKSSDFASTPDFAGPSADTQAQLEQANLRAAISARSAQLANAFVGSIGIGLPNRAGPVIVFNTAFTPTAEQAAQAAAGVTMGLAAQGFRPASRVALGV